MLKKKLSIGAIFAGSLISLLGAPTISIAQTAKDDASALISSYDVLGIRLGMSETQARAALTSYVPAGHNTDRLGKVMKVALRDYKLVNPINQTEVRAGFLVSYVGKDYDGGYNFIKVFIFNDKVWGVWRGDQSGNYDYSQAKDNMKNKYLGAQPTKTDIRKVIGNSFEGSEGVDVGGFEISEGRCSNAPFSTVNQSDSISLSPGCLKFFRVGYEIHSKSGLKSLSNGSSQLVDLKVGGAFFDSMKTSAKASAAQDQKGLGGGKF